jgi:integrase
VTTRKIKVRAEHGYIARHRDGFRAEITFDGERVRKTFPTEGEAQRFLEEICRRSIRYGISFDKTRVTWLELVASFLEARELANVKKTTLRIYRNEMRYTHEWDRLPVQRLTAEHVTRLLARLKKGDKPLAPKSLYNIRGTIHAVLKHGIALDILDRNVCDQVKAPQVPDSNPTVWTRAQLQRFLKAIDGDRLETFLWVVASTGMRKGEACALQWGDINLQTGEVVISRRLLRIGGGEGIDIDTPKSRAGARVVYLPAPALGKVAAWRERQQVERKVHAHLWTERGWVFTTRTGNHFEPRWVNKHLTEILATHGLGYITVHGLRHTFVTMLLQSGESVRDVQSAVGHAKPSVTMNMYWRVLPGSGTRVATKMGELLRDEISPGFPPDGA